MSIVISRATAALALACLMMMAVGPNAVLATPQTGGTGMRTAGPFTEMLPGVYVASTWWNESGEQDSDDTIWEPTQATNVTRVEPTTTVTVYPSDGETYTGNTTGPMNPIYPTFPEDVIAYVEDINGAGYWIKKDYEYEWSYGWSYSTLLVSIVLDPDGSFISWLSTLGQIENLWLVYWAPNYDALSGDEVVIFSAFYYHQTHNTGFYNANYTWFDMSMNPVDPDEIVLASDYDWAEYMSGSEQYDYNDNYTYYGYDINEMYFADNQSRWMEHYFSGMTVFNDTNGNGIMDIVYDEVGQDIDHDGRDDWMYHALNASASEMVYDFYSSDAVLGSVEEPHINDNGQIEWSAEVMDIHGQLIKTNSEDIPRVQCPVEYEVGALVPVLPYEPEIVDTRVDSLKMTYRFEVTDDAAVLKIDQYIGDFREPGTGGVLQQVRGLGITLDYWSSFSVHNITAQDEGGTQVTHDAPAVGVVESGTLEFSDDPDIDVRTSVSFGGTYVWGKDGGVYNVGTAIMPMYFFGMGFARGAPESYAAVTEAADYMTTSFYYSSCYSKWDGHSITHDPIFKVYPGTPPGEVSQLVSGVVYGSVAVAIVGVIALVAVAVRIRSAR